MRAIKNISLNELLIKTAIEPLEVSGDLDVLVTGISTHAQRTERGEIFVAIKGTRIDSHLMLGEAVESGASVLFVEQPVPSYPNVTVVQVASTRSILGVLAQALKGFPARQITTTAITSTNGKTTTSYLLYHILEGAGYRSAQIGTLGVTYLGKNSEGQTTTPDPLKLAEIYAELVEASVTHVAMEASSHAIDQHRIAGIPIKCGAFLNLTQDHLDYHGTFENYAKAKKKLFSDYVLPTLGSKACFNLDDPVGQQLALEYTGDYIGFTRNLSTPADVYAEHIAFSVHQTSFVLCLGGEKRPLTAPLAGTFNIENILAAASCAHCLGIDLDTIVRSIESVDPVPGRFEFIKEGQNFSVVVDYAHTPDALYRLLRSARRICPGQLIVVFGCGGDRDQGKRAIMGKIAGDWADFVIVTSDNPRTEIPGFIADQIVQGVLQSQLRPNRYQVVLDRRKAIEQGLTLAGPDDMVIIAGKGHENYQDVGSTRLSFDDRQIAREILHDLMDMQPSLHVDEITFSEKPL